MKIRVDIGRLIVIAGIFLVSSCRNDFELNAPYSRLPVVYGLLDPTQEKQFFIIQRTFLTDGNAYDFTEIEDSVIYDFVDAKLLWDDGSKSASLTPEVIDDKDTDGLFFAPYQLVYSVPTDSIVFENNWDENFYLSISADEDTIYSETDVINMTASNLNLSPFGNLDLVVSLGSESTPVVYDVAIIKFSSSKNALKHSVDIRVNYTEFYVGGNSEQKSFESTIRTIRPLNDEGGEELTINFFGESFFQKVKANIPVDNNVVWRVIDQTQLIYRAYGRDLTRYVDFTNSSSNIGQESNRYSNINDGLGLGIFSTRSEYVRNMQLSTQSQIELSEGQHTGQLAF